VKRGDNQSRKVNLAPPYLNVLGHNIPLDIPLLVIGFILTFYTQQTATFLHLQMNLTDLKTIGQGLLLVGAVFFIFGRIELRR
jgi:hypothetical protein